MLAEGDPPTGWWGKQYRRFENWLTEKSTESNRWHRFLAWAFLPLAYRSIDHLDQIRVISESRSGPALGRVRHFSMGTDRLTLMASAMSAGYYLLLVMKAGAPVGRARFELRRALLEFEKDLY